MKTKYLIMLSEILDKMDIKDELKTMKVDTGDEKRDVEELGTQLISLILTRIYKCKNEFYTFIAAFKNYLPDENQYEFYPEVGETYTKEQIDTKKSLLKEQYNRDLKSALKQAEDEDVISIIKEISNIDGIKSFLSIA